MIYAAPGATIIATLANAPTGLVGTMGVQILNSAGAAVLARKTTGIVEQPAGSGEYIATLVVPTTAGTYVVFWDNGVISPSTTSDEELIVTWTTPEALAPSGSNLCTLSEVRAVMQKKLSDTISNPLIELMIPSVSENIMRRCGREFAPATNALTRTFEWPWEGQYVSLAPYDLRNLTEVTVDSDVSQGGQVISAQEYRLWPQPPADGTYLSIRLQPFGAVLDRIVWRNRQVKIKGDWGFLEVPADVKLAAAFTVAHQVRINSGVWRSSHEDPNPEPPKRGIPPEAWDILSRYTRTVAA
jgi:hypothetical protein